MGMYLYNGYGLNMHLCGGLEPVGDGGTGCDCPYYKQIKKGIIERYVGSLDYIINYSICIYKTNIIIILLFYY